MRAAILHAPHTALTIAPVDLDSPGPGEVAVKMAAAGVCHSDYHRIDGHLGIDTLPYIPGHEGSGVVEEVGEGVTTLAPGDHVVFSLTAQCGRCRNCTAGKTNLCEWHQLGSGFMPNGTHRFTQSGTPIYADLATFADRTVVAEGYLVKIRDDVPLDKACLVGCGVMTGIGAVVNRAKVEPGSTAVVIGCGGVGLNVVQGCSLSSASKIIAVDTVDSKLGYAESVGATHFINSSKQDALAEINRITWGGADYSFEVVGLTPTINLAFAAIRPGGTCVMVGVPAAGVDVSVPGMSLFFDRTVMGTFYGSARPREDFPWILDMYMDGRLKLDELLTATRPLDELNEAFDDMVAGRQARTVLSFS
jgi:S-(hydroxymethyl)glutathione dehydrogenase / alcohol dehydrogenase